MRIGLANTGRPFLFYTKTTMIQYIDYQGQKLPYRTSYLAFTWFEEEMGKPYTQIDEQSPKEVEALFFYSLKAGHRAEKQEFSIKREDIPDILDEVYPQLIEKGVEALEGKQKKSLMRRIFG